ncbi:MAG: type II secretion system protein M [Sphingomonadales bacterium]|nr:type II secretion system protein M [Sphingomonadales bacterium]
MIASINTWYQALSQREKILIGVAALLSALALVVLVSMGLLSAISAKQADYYAALERRAQIVNRVAAMDAKAVNRTDQNSSLQQLISQSAAEAGFALDRADAPHGNIVDIAMAKAKPSALMSWLNAWEAQGVVVQKIDIKAGNDGTVSMTASLARPAS